MLPQIARAHSPVVTSNPGYKNIIEYRVLTTKNMIIENQRLTWSLVRSREKKEKSYGIS